MWRARRSGRIWRRCRTCWWQVRRVLVDPKQVELNHYESIPHLLTPVITSPRMAANALQNLVKEMEQRYGIMSLSRTRSLIELNRARAKRGEAPLPYILCVIDELADLMMVAPADVADRLRRLLADRLARDPRSERRRVAARPGRHALQPRRQLAPATHPGRLHRRGPARQAD